MKKYVMILAAVVALGATAAATTSASAHWHGPHWGGYWGGYWGGWDYHPCHFSWYPFPHKVCEFEDY